MSDEIERRLRDSFDAQARAGVPDGALPPPPRFATAAATGGAAARRHGRWLAPLAAAAVVLAVVGTILGLQSGSDHHNQQPVAVPSGQNPSSTAIQTAAAAPVDMRMAPADGATYGVGMPVVAYFSHTFSSAKPLAAATAVTVRGKPVQAAWYFETSTEPGYPIEGHLRMPDYWPAHADVHVAVAANTLTAATTVDFKTGARTIAVVEDAKHKMILTRDGKQIGVYPVSLGASTTPTERGVKVIMEKRPSVCMHDVAGTYYECGIKLAQQLTSSGEYLHAAPWNVQNIRAGIDTSNGCTNLLPADASTLYKTLEVGDVVSYPDAKGPEMKVAGGYGDWNVPWAVWLKGGLIPTG
jgi:lipoprotein-anchoring transpeptidase ErfK/SrfK